MIRRGMAPPVSLCSRMMWMIVRAMENRNAGMESGPDTRGCPARSLSPCPDSVIHRRKLLRRAHLDESDRSFLGIREAVCHEGIEPFAALLRVEHGLEHRAAARRHGVRLHIAEHVRGIAIRIHAVEDRAHNVEV